MSKCIQRARHCSQPMRCIRKCDVSFYLSVQGTSFMLFLLTRGNTAWVTFTVQKQVKSTDGPWLMMVWLYYGVKMTSTQQKLTRRSSDVPWRRCTKCIFDLLVFSIYDGFIGLLTPSQVEGHVYNAVPMALGLSLEELSPRSEGTSHLTVSTGPTYCGEW